MEERRANRLGGRVAVVGFLSATPARLDNVLSGSKRGTSARKPLTCNGCGRSEPRRREGLLRLLDLLPQIHGKLDRELGETALGLIGADGRARLRSRADGQTVTRAWGQRRAALDAYRERCVQDGDGQLVLRTLLHDHHLRAVGVDPGVEKVTNRLARAVAQRRIALSRQGAS